MNVFKPWRKFLIKESGFNRIRNILLGKVASVDTVGFMTAENPMAQKLSSKENRCVIGAMDLFVFVAALEAKSDHL